MGGGEGAISPLRLVTFFACVSVQPGLDPANVLPYRRGMKPFGPVTQFLFLITALTAVLTLASYTTLDLSWGGSFVAGAVLAVVILVAEKVVQ